MSTEDLCGDLAAVSERVVAADERLAALKERVDRSETRRASLVGAAIAVALAAFGATRYIVLLEGRANELERRIDRIEMRGRPAEPFPLLPSLNTEPPLVGLTQEQSL